MEFAESSSDGWWFLNSWRICRLIFGNFYERMPASFHPKWTDQLYASNCGSKPANNVSVEWFVTLREWMLWLFRFYLFVILKLHSVVQLLIWKLERHVLCQISCFSFYTDFFFQAELKFVDRLQINVHLFWYFITLFFLSENAKQCLITASQMWGIPAFLSFVPLQIKHLSILGYLSDKTSNLKASTSIFLTFFLHFKE